LNNLEQAAEAFQRFQYQIAKISNVGNKKFFDIICVNKIKVGSLSDPITKAATTHLTDLYDHIITKWLYILPKKIPIRTRTSKERTIRQIVGELVLARMNRLRNTLKPGPIERMPNVEENAFNPLHWDINLESEMEYNGSQIGSLLSNSTVENRRDYQEKKGLLSQDIHFSILPLLSQMRENIAFRRSINNVLSHWDIGVDPRSYDWSRITREEEEVEREQVERNRSRRTRSRSGRSQSRIPEGKSKLIRTSPIVPVVQQWEPHFQEGATLHAVQSSLITDENLPMTQIERGIFGGREAAKRSTIKARKKKRAAGF
jgi:RNA polymerase I-specific transcription initiation factor RRN6